MKAGQKIETTLILRDAEWVGKTKPVIRHRFNDSRGAEFTVYSTANWLKDVGINEAVPVRGVVKKVSDRGVVLSKLRPNYG